LAEAIQILAEYGEDALPISGGTDLVPNMKHRLFQPGHLVALKGLPELRGVVEDEGFLSIGAAETLTSIFANPRVQSTFPALSHAAGQVAGPQLRNAGTLGGNICLETRCTYYNQTLFWRKALGFCLKKDGDVCHVTRVGRKCVASHSADTPPVLMTLGAIVDLEGPAGPRSIPIQDFFVADGIKNSRREVGEVVTRVRIPLPPDDLRTAFAKLRQRQAIDFPLLTVAIAARVDEEERVHEIRGVVTALGAQPRELTGWDRIANGKLLDDSLVEALAQRAHRQCHPLETIIVDPEWRRAMVPVYIRRALATIRAA